MRRLWTLVLGIAVASVVGCDRSVTVVDPVTSTASCLSCHGDSATVIVTAGQQWENSRHASGATLDHNTASCNPCHTSEGFVAAVSGAAPPTVLDNPTPIHCFTCHAPHERGDMSLRVEGPVAFQNGEAVDMGAANICIACHQSRQNVDTTVRAANGHVTFDTNHWGPHHSAQGDVFAGTNGYEYPLVPYFAGPHLPKTANGCLDCHSDIVANSVLGGHSFNMTARVAGEDVENIAACNQPGCHTGVVNFNHNDIQDDVDVLLSTLRALLITRGLVNAEGDPMAGRVVASSDTAGAVWNYLLVRDDGSGGVHNPEYTTDLLGSSILFLGGTLPPLAGRSDPVLDR